MALLAVTAAGCGAPPEPGDRTDAAAPLPVSVIVTSMAPLAERIEAGGTVAAPLSATLAGRIVAPVISVRVRPGDRVRTGDVLVVLDDRDLAARARQAEASIGAAEEGLRAATTELGGAGADQTLAAAWQGRVSALHARRSATTQELDEAEARLAGANARLQGSQARVAQAAAQLAAARAAGDAAVAAASFAVIRAPFDGLVTERLLDPGSVASPAVPLLRLDAAGTPHVEVDVDAARARFVGPGDRVEVLLDGEPGYDPRPLTGLVTEVARTIAADSRTFRVKVALPDGHAARSGSFARVWFHGPVRQALLVPASAIRTQGQLTTLFVVQDGEARLRLLQVAAQGDSEVEVIAGLDSGETIVVAPPPELEDGRRVVTADASYAEPRP